MKVRLGNLGDVGMVHRAFTEDVTAACVTRDSRDQQKGCRHLAKQRIKEEVVILLTGLFLVL